MTAIKGGAAMSVTYGILCAVSLALIGVCLAVDRKKELCLFLLFISVFVCILGHFLISIAPSLNFALNANRIAYLGQVFLPLLLLKMTLNLSNIKLKKWILTALTIIGVAVLLITLTPGLFPCYYSSVSIEVVDGVTKLVREYGPLHLVYYFYLLAYFGMMIAAIIYGTIKKKIVAKLHVVFLTCAVLCNIIIWAAEQFLPRGFEFLTVSYIMSELFILLLYGILQEYGIITKNGSVVIAHTAEKADAYLSGKIVSSESDYTTLFSEQQIEDICTNPTVVELFTERELSVLKLLLVNKQRKEIAEALYVTESTIKKHTKSIFFKMNVTNRYGLYAKLKQYI